MNDIIKRTLSSGNFNAVLEHVGLDCEDGKRSDEMTVFIFPWGKCLVWDSTCIESFSINIDCGCS